MNEKISPEHLKRAAYVYVRQSTGHQVRHHQQGRERQYALKERARELGFAKTVVIDEDQGRSGSGLVECPGFAELLSAVCRGDVGAVLALEVSRLARNNLDWHHLIELCALTQTLIIDADGVYDSRALNDRLLLGLKGTMSEFELSLFRQRAREAFERKIRSGHAMWEVPVGFVRTEEHRVEKIADRQVQAAIEGVFVKFRELGSARQTMLWYRDQQIPLVDPENRLVAGELEARWNAALRHEAELEEQLASVDKQRSQLTDNERQRLLELGNDLSAVWNHPAVSDELKKRVLRTVLEEIVIANNEGGTEHVLYLHWKGGIHTELRVARNRSGKHRNTTETTALELIEALSKVCSDQTIAATLNRLGYRTGVGKTWRVHSVHSVRYYYRLPNHRNSDSWLTVDQASQELGVSQTVIRRLVREKTLPAEQIVETTPWIIARQNLSLPTVQAEVNAVRQGRQLRRQAPNQQELPFK